MAGVKPVAVISPGGGADSHPLYIGEEELVKSLQAALTIGSRTEGSIDCATLENTPPVS